jgi:hypothetical protein
MKRINIKNNQGMIISMTEMMEHESWLQGCIVSNCWGHSERWVHENEPHDPMDIIEERIIEDSPAIQEVTNESGEIVQPFVPSVSHKEFKLKAEYTVEITDISQEYALQECIQKRKSEYPSPEEFMNAYFDGGEQAVAELQAKRLAVKAKYPKP